MEVDLFFLYVHGALKYFQKAFVIALLKTLAVEIFSV
jgi:hypothetical protein